MYVKIAWGFCNMAFEASQDQSFPVPMRRFFRGWGVFWYWAALMLEGRALEIWRELRAQERTRGRRRPLAVWPASWQRRARQLKAAARRRRLRSAQDVAAVPEPGDCVRVAAWSLPDVSSIRSLGLGSVWAILCPFCQRFHTHAPHEGSRAAQCKVGSRYILEHAGELPAELRNRFRHSVSGDWPKVLLEWPDTMPAVLDAA